MACLPNLIPFDLYPCPPRPHFRMLDMRGVVSDFEKYENSFTLRLGRYPAKMEFFFTPPDWLYNGCDVKIDIDGQHVYMVLCSGVLGTFEVKDISMSLEHPTFVTVICDTALNIGHGSNRYTFSTHSLERDLLYIDLFTNSKQAQISSDGPFIEVYNYIMTLHKTENAILELKARKTQKNP